MILSYIFVETISHFSIIITRTYHSPYWRYQYGIRAALVVINQNMHNVILINTYIPYTSIKNVEEEYPLNPLKSVFRRPPPLQ